MTPQGWNSSIYNMVQSLSNSVIVPIAGIIITMVLCYELISMLTERNNLHDVDTWMFFKYFFKMWVAVFLVSNTWTITMAVFDVGKAWSTAPRGQSAAARPLIYRPSHPPSAPRWNRWNWANCLS